MKPAHVGAIEAYDYRRVLVWDCRGLHDAIFIVNGTHFDGRRGWVSSLRRLRGEKETICSFTAPELA